MTKEQAEEINTIKTQFAKTIDTLADIQTKQENEIKEMVIEHGASVKGYELHAIYPSVTIRKAK